MYYFNFLLEYYKFSIKGIAVYNIKGRESRNIAYNELNYHNMVF